MERIISIVGFLGAGKTTLLKHLTDQLLEGNWSPFIILNDYENASLDASQFIEKLSPKWVKPLNGSCICCSGLTELRNNVNRIPEREKGVTLIEANGTSDACALNGFLGVGIHDRFSPPIQLSVVDCKNWQKRGEHNDLEANQIQLSSIVVLTYLDHIDKERRTEVIKSVRQFNPFAKIVGLEDLDIRILMEASPSENNPEKLEHHKAHWASCSIDLPNLPSMESIQTLCDALPNSILRVKGFTKIGDDSDYTYFEQTPDGKIATRPFKGQPMMGAKFLTIGLGSSKETLSDAVGKVFSLD